MTKHKIKKSPKSAVGKNKLLLILLLLIWCWDRAAGPLLNLLRILHFCNITIIIIVVLIIIIIIIIICITITICIISVKKMLYTSFYL